MATGGSGAAAGEPKSEQEVVQRFSDMRSEVGQIWSKVNELEGEMQEHDLVIKAIKEMDPKRKCFRLVGGVLVERTIGEVLPAVETNKQGITGIKDQLFQQFETKKEELKEFQDKYKIRVKGDKGDVTEGAEKKGSSGIEGVLA